MAALEQGQRLGSYTIDRLVGRGGMAEVYRATHETLDRTAAIKVLDRALYYDPTFPLRFLREARTVAALNHPNIITVYDFGEAGDVSYLVMELATGGTLRSLSRRLSTLGEVVAALSTVGAALQYAHDRGVIHRDLKPLNVLIGEDGRLLLADFGLARVVSESLDLGQSDTGAAFGTPSYMAPEQAIGQDTDARADIYSLGIMAYELLTGAVPYRGASSMAVMQQHISAPPPSIRAVLPEAPVVLEEAIQRATAKDRADRYGRAGEFVSALQAIAAAAPLLAIGAAAVSAVDARTGSVSGPLVASIDSAEHAALFTPAPWAARARIPAGDPPVAEAGADGADAQPVLDRNADAPEAASLAAGPGGHRRRPTSFRDYQWLTLGLAVVIVLFINVVGLWLTRAGTSGTGGNAAKRLTVYINDHLDAFKSSLTAFAVLFALLAVLSMRRAIVEDHHLGLRQYRLLRQYHRFAGYCAVLIAVATGLLTCIGIYGFSAASPRIVLHSIFGTGLLVLIGVKLAIVRYYPRQRRHLQLVGEGILVFFVLVLATSTVPYVWSQVTGSGSSTGYHAAAQPASMAGEARR